MEEVVYVIAVVPSCKMGNVNFFAIIQADNGVTTYRFTSDI